MIFNSWFDFYFILYLFDINIWTKIHCDSEDEDDGDSFDDQNNNNNNNSNNNNIDTGKGVLNISENISEEGKESYTINVDKETFLKGANVVGKVVTDGLPILGIGLAAGNVAKGVMSASVSTPGVKAVIGTGSALVVGLGLYGCKELIDNKLKIKSASNDIREMIRTRAGGVDNLVSSNRTQLPEVNLPVGDSNSSIS